MVWRSGARFCYESQACSDRRGSSIFPAQNSFTYEKHRQLGITYWREESALSTENAKQRIRLKQKGSREGSCTRGSFKPPYEGSSVWGSSIRPSVRCLPPKSSSAAIRGTVSVVEEEKFSNRQSSNIRQIWSEKQLFWNEKFSLPWSWRQGWKRRLYCNKTCEIWQQSYG